MRSIEKIEAVSYTHLDVYKRQYGSYGPGDNYAVDIFGNESETTKKNSSKTEKTTTSKKNNSGNSNKNDDGWSDFY